MAAAPLCVTMRAPAKVNLCLRITGKRDDGYHLLDSIVVFTEFGDQVTISEAEKDKLAVTGPFADQLTGSPDDNICIKALTAYRAAGGHIGPVRIDVEKNIPVGAGLGGGSSDAAAILKGLNRLNEQPFDDSQLHKLGLSLGADVPACLVGSSLRMQGIGELITPIKDVKPCHMLLANPGKPLATIDVFRALGADNLADKTALSSEIMQAEDIVKAGNSLEPAAIGLMPEIGDLMGMLRASEHVQAVRMSGSGATCIAIFPTADSCAAAAISLTAQGIWSRPTMIL
ncbi:MAG: 4-(cytidine 5'-diphospho)-2-C-methyl-D-erythritol kinase [Alphaproteobacteria bacterium]